MTSLSRVTLPAASEHLTELIGCPISRPSLLPALILNQGPFPPPALPGFIGTTSLSATPQRPALPSRASGWSSRPRHGASRVAYVVLVYMLSPLPRHSDERYHFAQSVSSYQPSPIGLPGRPVHCPFRGLLSVHSRYGLHTRAVTVFRDTLHRRLQPLRCLHGCSGCFRREHFAGWGLHPLEQHRLITAHTQTGR